MNRAMAFSSDCREAPAPPASPSPAPAATAAITQSRRRARRRSRETRAARRHDRESGSCRARGLHQVLRAADCAQDPHVRAAAAEIDVEALANLVVARIGTPLEQALRAHHHPRDAIAALRRLLVDERALHRTRILDRAEAF